MKQQIIWIGKFTYNAKFNHLTRAPAQSYTYDNRQNIFLPKMLTAKGVANENRKRGKALKNKKSNPQIAKEWLVLIGWFSILLILKLAFHIYSGWVFLFFLIVYFIYAVWKNNYHITKLKE